MGSAQGVRSDVAETGKSPLEANGTLLGPSEPRKPGLSRAFFMGDAGLETTPSQDLKLESTRSRAFPKPGARDHIRGNIQSVHCVADVLGDMDALEGSDTPVARLSAWSTTAPAQPFATYRTGDGLG